MKKYMHYQENERSRQDAIQYKLDDLKLFRDLLRNVPELNARFDGKALEIAAGLDPWIEMLEKSIGS